MLTYSISQKILFVISLSLLIILSNFIAFMELRGYQFQLEQLRNQQSLITEGQAILLAQQIYDQDEEASFLTVSGILANPTIIGVSIEYEMEEDSLEIGEVDGTLKHSFPITYVDDELGFIELAKLHTFASTRLIDDALKNRFLYLAALVLVLLGAIISVTAIALRNIVGKPLSKVVEAIENSADEAPQIDWQSSDEMGLVVQRLNDLHFEQQQKVDGLKQALSDSERREAERLRNLANASFEAILIYHDNTPLDLNKPMEKLIGLSRETILSKQVTELFDTKVSDCLQIDLAEEQVYFSETTLTPAGASPVPIEMFVDKFDYDSPNTRVAVMRDISERHKAEAKIRHMAHYDGLTGLLNRASFMDRMEQMVNSASKNGTSLAVMYLDLDRFKEVNDVHGHAAGDALLHKVAMAIKDNIRGTDQAARLGGDEFAIILEGGSQSELHPESLSQRLLNAVEKCKTSSSIGSDFGASIGIAISAHGDIELSDLLMQADLALYHAKEKGKNRFEYYNETLDNNFRRQRILVERLTDAIENDSLELYFQPQALSASDEIVGFEALLRWHDPLLGCISPVEIVAAAEKEGIMRKLGAWVLKRACREAVSWQHPYNIAVNLSPTELVGDELADYVAEVLEETKLSPGRLELEITETAIVSDVEHATKVLAQLKKLGVTIAMDDFGTGYSSLSLLQKFPFDRIKIDKSFVSADTEDSSGLIASAVIDLGQRMNVDVVAEGVETELQLQKLKDQNCEVVQGFLIGHPMPQDQLHDYIANLSSPIKLAS